MIRPPTGVTLTPPVPAELRYGPSVTPAQRTLYLRSFSCAPTPTRMTGLTGTGGDWWGANAWPANTRDTRIYQEHS